MSKPTKDIRAIAGALERGRPATVELARWFNRGADRGRWDALERDAGHLVESLDGPQAPRLLAASLAETLAERSRHLPDAGVGATLLAHAATLARAAGDRELAEEWLIEAARRAPVEGVARALAAFVEGDAEQDDAEDARKRLVAAYRWIGHVAADDHQGARALARAGQIALEIGLQQLAGRCFEEALGRDAACEEAQAGLRRIDASRAEVRERLAALRRAVERAADAAERARQLIRLGDALEQAASTAPAPERDELHNEALEAWERALDEAGDEAAAQRLERAVAQRGNRRRLRALWGRLIQRLEPGSPRRTAALRALGLDRIASNSARERARGATYLREAFEAGARDDEVLDALEAYLREQGDRDALVAVLRARFDRATSTESSLRAARALASLYWEAGDIDAAAPWIERCAALDPDEPLASALREELAARGGDWDAWAASVVQRARSLDDDRAAVVVREAVERLRAVQDSGDIAPEALAAAWARLAPVLDPAQEEAWRAALAALDEAGRSADALHALDAWANACDEPARRHALLHEGLIRCLRLPECSAADVARWGEQIVALDAPPPGVLEWVAEACQVAGRLEAAEALWERLASEAPLEPTRRRARRRRAALLARGDAEARRTAAHLLWELVNDAPEDRAASAALEDLLGELGDDAGMAELWTLRAHQAPPAEAVAWWRKVAALRERLGQYDEAIDVWRGLGEDTPDALPALLRLYRAAGRWNELERALAQSAAQTDDLRAASLLAERARVLDEKLGRQDDAIAAWQAALGRDPFLAEARAALRAHGVEPPPLHVEALGEPTAETWQAWVERAEAVLGELDDDTAVRLRVEVARVCGELGAAWECAARHLAEALTQRPDDADIAARLWEAARHAGPAARPAALRAARVVARLAREASLRAEAARALFEAAVAADDASDAVAWGIRWVRADVERGAQPDLDAIEAQATDDEAVVHLVEAWREAAEAASNPSTAMALRLRAAQLAWRRLGDASTALAALAGVIDAIAPPAEALALAEEIALAGAHWDLLERVWWRRATEAATPAEARPHLLRLGELYESLLDDPARAVDVYGRLCELAPGDDEALEGHVRCLEALGRWKEAADDLARLAGLVEPGARKAAALAHRARLLVEQLDDLDAGVEALGEAVQSDPTTEEAIELLERLVAQSDALRARAAPLLVQARRAVGGAREEHAALERVARAARGASDETRWQRELARVEEDALRDYAAAFSRWRELLQHTPHDPEAWEAAERTATAAGELEALAAMMATACGRAPDEGRPATPVVEVESLRAELLDRLARIAEENLGDEALAAWAATELARARPHDGNALERAARALETMGDWEALCEMLAQIAAHEAEPARRAELLARRARLLWRQLGDTDRAAHAYEDALAVQWNAEWADSLRTVYAESERWESLADLLRQRAGRAASAAEAARHYRALIDVLDVWLEELDEAVDVACRALGERWDDDIAAWLFEALTGPRGDGIERERALRAARTLREHLAQRGAHGELVALLRREARWLDGTPQAAQAWLDAAAAALAHGADADALADAARGLALATDLENAWQRVESMHLEPAQWAALAQGIASENWFEGTSADRAASVLMRIAGILKETGDGPGAVRALRAAVERAPAHVGAHRALLGALFGVEAYDELTDVALGFERASEALDDVVSLLGQAADLCEQADRVDEAFALARRAAALAQPGEQRAEAVQRLLQLAERAHDDAAVVEGLAELAASAPTRDGRTALLQAAARRAQRAGLRARAIELYEAVAREVGGSVEVAAELADLYEAEEQWDHLADLLAWWVEAAGTSEQTGAVLERLARAHLAAGRPGEAARAARDAVLAGADEALAMFPAALEGARRPERVTVAEAWLEAARHVARPAEIVQARAAVARAQDDPAEAARGLAEATRIALDGGDLQVASALAREAVECAPDEPDAWEAWWAAASAAGAASDFAAQAEVHAAAVRAAPADVRNAIAQTWLGAAEAMVAGGTEGSRQGSGPAGDWVRRLTCAAGSILPNVSVVERAFELAWSFSDLSAAGGTTKPGAVADVLRAVARAVVEDAPEAEPQQRGALLAVVARAWERAGDEDEALSAWRAAWTAAPLDPEIIDGLDEALRRAGAGAERCDVLEFCALEAPEGPHRTRLWLRLAAAAGATPGESERAFEALEQARTHGASAVEVLEAAESFLLEAGKHDTLVALYREAAGQTGGTAARSLHFKRAFLLGEELGRLGEAVEELAGVLATDGDYTPAHRLVQRWARRLVEQMARGEELPEGAMALAELAVGSLGNRGGPELWEVGALAAPSPAERAHRLARAACAYLDGEEPAWEAACRAAAAALRAHPSSKAAVRAAQRVLSTLPPDLAVGEETVVAALERVAETLDGDAAAARLLVAGAFLEARERFDEARAVYERALDAVPLHPAVHEHLERLYAREGDRLAVARLVRMRAEAAEGERAAALWTRTGNLLAVAGNIAEAIEAYERALEAEPTWARAAQRLEDLYAKGERWDAYVRLVRPRVDAGDDPERRVGRLLLLAHAYEEALGEPREALQCYAAAFEADRHNERALAGIERLAPTLGAWEHYVDALRARRAGVDEPSERIAIDFAMAETYRLHLDQPGTALDYYRLVLAEDEHHEGARDGLRALAQQPRWRLPAALSLETVCEASGDWQGVCEALALQREAAQSDQAAAAALAVREAEIRVARLDDASGAFALLAQVYDEVGPEPGRTVRDAAEALADDYGAWALLASALRAGHDAEGALRRRDRWLADVLAGPLGDPTAAASLYRRIARAEALPEGERVAALDALVTQGASFEGEAGHDASLRAFLEELAQGQEGAVGVRAAEVLAATARRAGDGREALRWLLDAARRAPEALAVDELLGVITQFGPQELGDLVEQAAGVLRDAGHLEAFAEVRELQAASSSAPHLRARWRREAGEALLEDDARRRDGAARLLRALRDAPDDLAPMLERIVELAVETGLDRELVAALEEAARVATDAALRLRLVEQAAILARDNLGDDPLAERLLRTILQRDATHRGAIDALVEILERAGRHGELIDVIRHKLRLPLDVSERYEALRQLARSARVRRDYETAAEALEAAVELAPEPSGVLRELEAVYEHLEDPVRLASTLRRRIEATATSEDVWALWQRLARIYEQDIGDVRAAAAVYEEALQRDDSHAVEALRALERLYRSLSAWTSLQRVLEKLLEVAPTQSARARIYRDLATLAEDHLGDEDTAIAYWRRVLSLQRDDEEAGQHLLRLLHRRGRHEELVEALAGMARAVTTPTQRHAMLVRAARVALERLRDVRRAAQLLAEVTAEAPEHTAALLLRARIFEVQGDLARARAQLDEVLASADGANTRAAALTALARLHLAEGTPEALRAAHQALLQATSLRASNVEAWQLLAKVHELREEWAPLAEALERQLEWIDAPGPRAALCRRLGLVCRDHLGRPDEAIQWLEEANLLVPEDETTVEALVETYASHGDVLAARPYVEWLLRRRLRAKRHEDVPRLAYLLGRALEESGDAARAIEAYRIAYRHDATFLPNLRALGALLLRGGALRDALAVYQAMQLQLTSAPSAERVDVFHMLGTIFERLGQADRARRYYRRALQLDPHHAASRQALENLDATAK